RPRRAPDLPPFRTRRSSELEAPRRRGRALVGARGWRTQPRHRPPLAKLRRARRRRRRPRALLRAVLADRDAAPPRANGGNARGGDRKSTRLNSSHVKTAYAA